MQLHVVISPNAKRSQILGWQSHALKLKIAAPPLEGKANQELIRFLADKLDLAPSTIQLLKGHTSKQKTLELPLTEAELRAKLSNLLEQPSLL